MITTYLIRNGIIEINGTDLNLNNINAKNQEDVSYQYEASSFISSHFINTGFSSALTIILCNPGLRDSFLSKVTVAQEMPAASNVSAARPSIDRDNSAVSLGALTHMLIEKVSASDEEANVKS